MLHIARGRGLPQYPVVPPAGAIFPAAGNPLRYLEAWDERPRNTKPAVVIRQGFSNRAVFALDEIVPLGRGSFGYSGDLRKE